MIRSRPRRSSTAFTLIEVLVAIVIMSIIAGAATLSFTKPIRAVHIRDVREQVRYLDDSARQYARRFNRPVNLIFDLSTGTLARRDGDGSANNRVSYQSSLPPGYRIETLRTASRRSSGGEADIPCSPLGISPTYALHLTGPGLDEWMLVTGLGGETITLNDERTLDSILQIDSAR